MKNLAWLGALLALSLAIAGCPGSSTPGDAGPGDAGALDAPAPLDAPPDDGAAADVPATDAPAADAPDTSCPPPECAAPPPGCRWQSDDPCVCGTLVCEPVGCDPACAATDYCDLCAPSPVCAVRPANEGRICPAIYMPVCGCDGMTYSNSCTLASAGIGRLHDGECEPAPGDCGGATCSATEYCNYGSACGGDGRCEVRPDFCPFIYAPVCGCDGVTYDNSCAAAAAGVSVAADGECGVTTDCSGTTCNATEYCDYGAACGGDGTCRTRPEICPDIFRPVCGCDGMTYGNACDAAAAGVSVASDGECGCSPPCGPGQTCQVCRGPDGPIHVCLPDGTIC